jgi:hypothetical protein
MILTSSLRVHTSGKLACRALDQRLRLSSTHLSLSESDKDTNGIDSNNSEEDLNGNSFISSTSNNLSPEGYLPTDFSSLGDAKQSRVLLYIALALLPCLALIPFSCREISFHQSMRNIQLQVQIAKQLASRLRENAFV